MFHTGSLKVNYDTKYSLSSNVSERFELPTGQELSSLPGTRMSPKPSSEKGRSHRARGEKLSLGTLSTIGSCAVSRAELALALAWPSSQRFTGSGTIKKKQLTFSWGAESEGPAATSTIILSPLCGFTHTNTNTHTHREWVRGAHVTKTQQHDEQEGGLTHSG